MSNQNQELKHLLFVGSEVDFLERLVDEIPTKYGKNFLVLISNVKKKRAAEMEEAQRLMAIEAEKEQKKASRKPRIGKPQAPPESETETISIKSDKA